MSSVKLAKVPTMAQVVVKFTRLCTAISVKKDRLLVSIFVWMYDHVAAVRSFGHLVSGLWRPWNL